MAPLGVGEGETVGTPGDGFARRAVSSPFVEHVGVLYAATGLEEARAWLDQSFGRAPSAGPVAAIGPAILLALFGVVLLARGLSRQLPEGPAPHHVGTGRFLALAALPAIATPLILAPFDTRFLPVLVADYLALHLAIYGALTLALAAWAGAWPRARDGSGASPSPPTASSPSAASSTATSPVSFPSRARSDHGGHPARGDPRHAGRCGPAGGRSRPALAQVGGAAPVPRVARVGRGAGFRAALPFLLIILPVIL
jgi:hypothetical protein